MDRQKINSNMTLPEIITLLSEGHDKTAITLATIAVFLGEEDAAFLLLELDDMNIRGKQIWDGLQYYKGDPVEFMESVKRRDPHLIEAINKMGVPGSHQAVVKGASKMLPRPTLS